MSLRSALLSLFIKIKVASFLYSTLALLLLGLATEATATLSLVPHPHQEETEEDSLLDQWSPLLQGCQDCLNLQDCLERYG